MPENKNLLPPGIKNIYVVFGLALQNEDKKTNVADNKSKKERTNSDFSKFSSGMFYMAAFHNGLNK
ncbi:MAG: hypothetical protein NTY12_00555 [Candidatus Falkowbacteria bacterium]|nr:hypothetical protein [Candidatus Falkowbacteria bacterium]